MVKGGCQGLSSTVHTGSLHTGSGAAAVATFSRTSQAPAICAFVALVLEYLRYSDKGKAM